MSERSAGTRRPPVSPGLLGCGVVCALPLVAGFLWTGVLAADALSEARTERALELGLVAMLLLAFASVPPLVAASLGRSRAESQDAAVRRGNHPDRPWLWRSDWACGEVVHQEGTGGIVAIGLFALVWNSVVALLARAAWRSSPDNRLFLSSFLAVFLLAGLLLAAATVRMILQRLRFGRSSLALDALPATPGGQLSGVVHAPLALAGARAVDVSLRCLDISTGDGSGERLRWQDTLTLGQSSLDRGPSGLEVPVAFDLPADAVPTTPAPDRRQRTLWRLQVSAALAGADYEASFEVPVFTTDAVKHLSPSTTAVRARPLAASETPQPARSRIRVVPLAGGTGTALQLSMPAWLAKWTLIPLLLVPAAGWLGRQPVLADVPYPRVIAGGVAGVLCIWALDILAVLLTPSRIEIGGGRVLVRRGWGPLGWVRTIALDEVTGAVVRVDANGSRVQQNVDIRTRSGGVYWAALSLRDASEAKWLAGEIDRVVHGARTRGAGAQGPSGGGTGGPGGPVIA